MKKEPCFISEAVVVHNHLPGQPCIGKRDDDRRFRLQAWLEERMARAYARDDSDRGDAWRYLANRLD